MRFPAGLLAAASLAAFVPGPGAAAETLDAMVVTATRRPAPLAETLAPVIVIDEAEIRSSVALDLAELLRFHAGVEIARNGGPGQLTSVFLRGAESDHSLVMIDGVKVNPGTAGSAALQNISPRLVERIEIVKGPRSSLYGSEAIGGVINIITRRGPEGRHFSLGAGAGDHDTRAASAGGSWRSGRAGAGAHFARLSTGGFPTFRDSQDDRGFDNDTLSAWLAAPLGPVDAEVSLWSASGNTEYTDFFRAPQDQDFDNQLGRLRLAYTAGGWSSVLTLSRFVDEIRQGQLAPDPGDFVRTERDSLDWQTDFAVGSASITAGATVTREDTSGRSYGAPLEAYPGAGRAERDNEAVYLQTGLDLGRHQLLAAGRHTEDEVFGGIDTWNLSWGMPISGTVSLAAGAGRGFRAPSTADLYAFGGNPDLEPEVSFSWDAMLRFRPRANHLFSVGVFRTRIEDLIEYVDPDGFAEPAPGRNENVGDARIQGVELAWQGEWEHWDLRAEAVFQDPEDADTGEVLLRRARRTASMTVDRLLGPHRFGLQLLAASERYDFGGARLAGYVLANLTANLALGRHLQVRARLENLLDQDYELVDGYNTAGRGLYAGLAWNY
ncbi:MAG: TonB-dependent receptor [Gammaproteobacteria bacterium]